MGTYRTTKCPHCGYVLEDRAITAKERIGPPTAMCPACRNRYATGMKFWKDMNSPEKSFYILRSIGLFPYTILFYTFAFTLIPLLVSSIFINVEEFFFEQHFTLLVTYSIGIALIVTIFYIINEVIRIKSKGDKQDIVGLVDGSNKL